MSDVPEGVSQQLAVAHEAMEKTAAAGVDPKELQMGIEVEYEHTSDAKTAKRIALDHLAEISDYYTRLKKMEAGARKTNKEKEAMAPKKTAAPVNGEAELLKAINQVKLAQASKAQKPQAKAPVYSKKEAQAFMIGFLVKCSEAGVPAADLEKLAAMNMATILAALKNFGGGAAAGAKNLVGAGKGLVTGSMPAMAKAPAGAAGVAGEVTGAAGGPIAALLATLGIGRASAPKPEDQSIGQKLKGLMG